MTKEYKQRAYCTPDIFEQVLAGIRSGVTISQQIELNRDNLLFPCERTIREYISQDNARMQQYARAREIGADAMVDSTIDIADSMLDPQRASNRIKARQWHASKMRPKVYGDKLDIDMKGTIDVATAITAARQRAQLSIEPLTIDNEPSVEAYNVDPFT